MQLSKERESRAGGSAVTGWAGRAVRIRGENLDRVHGGSSQPEPEESVRQVKHTATMILKRLGEVGVKNGGSEAGRGELCRQDGGGRGWPEEARSPGR